MDPLWGLTDPGRSEEMPRRKRHSTASGPRPLVDTARLRAPAFELGILHRQGQAEGWGADQRELEKRQVLVGLGQDGE